MRLPSKVTLLALPIALVLSTGTTIAQSPFGSATVTGPVRIDGQNVTGGITVGNAARISTGDDASVSLKVAKGGEVKLAGQADIVATMDAVGPKIQLVCGEVNILNATPSTVISSHGARVFAREGRVVVTEGTKKTTLKKGKTKDFGAGALISITDPGSDVVVTSSAACDCNCGGGRP